LLFLFLATNHSLPFISIQLANRWRNLSYAERQPYLDLYQQDQERFAQESAAADAAALAALDRKRAQEATLTAVRGARASVEQERQQREARRERKQLLQAMDNSEEAQQRREALAVKKAQVQERRDKREEEQKFLAKQHKKLDKEEAKKAAARLDYLLKQSSIFAKLQGGKGSLPAASTSSDSKKGGSSSDKSKAAHHIHDANSNNEDEEEEEETVQHIFLTKQPSSIKFGHLKPYQLESLNWMIHLAEKGLNGILADGTCLVFGVVVTSALSGLSYVDSHDNVLT
jgi:SWI/SNF-related matrix-associated actin-dependent regulator of chromatin subfamily A member 5